MGAGTAPRHEPLLRLHLHAGLGAMGRMRWAGQLSTHGRLVASCEYYLARTPPDPDTGKAEGLIPVCRGGPGDWYPLRDDLDVLLAGEPIGHTQKERGKNRVNRHRRNAALERYGYIVSSYNVAKNGILIAAPAGDTVEFFIGRTESGRRATLHVRATARYLAALPDRQGGGTWLPLRDHLGLPDRLFPSP